MYDKRVILGFSGGIDSTAAALYLRDEGYEVTLETLDTVADPDFVSAAREAALKIGMPLHVSDVSCAFRDNIIGYFADSYMRGETPAPCTLCNVMIKWKTLYQRARESGCGHIATGHYFRIHHCGDTFFVRKGADPAKDQSYYLWALPQEYLAMALTPMGVRIKTDVKNVHGHLVAASESMGVCFLRGVNYADFLRRTVPGICDGDIVDRSGRIVGRHGGCALYTIGQKKNLDCGIDGAVVTGMDSANNCIIIGSDKDLYSGVLYVKDCVVPDMERLLCSGELEVRIRGIGRNPEGYARVRIIGSECSVTDTEDGTAFAALMPYGAGSALRLEITLSSPAWAAAKGQPVVFYERDIVLGGGFLYDYR